MSEHRTISAVALLAIGAILLTTVPSAIAVYTVANRAENATYQQALETQQQIAANVATNTNGAIGQYIDAVQAIANVPSFANSTAVDQEGLMLTLRATGVSYFETFNLDGSGKARSDGGALETLTLETMADVLKTHGNVELRDGDVSFVAPLTDVDMQVVGYVSAEVSETEFDSLITQESVPQASLTTVWIMDNNTHQTLIGKDSPPDVWDSTKGVQKIFENDGLHIVAYDPVQGRSWTAVIDNRAQPLQSMLDATHNLTIIIVLVIALISTVIAVFCARIVTIPLTGLVHASETFNTDEEPVSIPSTFISEIHRLSSAFDQMRSRLRHRMLDKERSLLIAQHAATMREQFMAVAAHELKSPLTSLQGNVQLALLRIKNGDLAQQEESLKRIDNQVKRLSNLVDSLMDASRIERGTLHIDMVPVDFDAIVAEVASMQWPTQGRIVYNHTKSPVYVLGDPIRLEQVVSNLVSNAVKYSPESSQVEVSLTVMPGVVRLYVRDHGPGVPLEIRDRMFERFIQGHNTSYQSGLGLGLFIAKQIVELHDGLIGAEFPDSGGTVLTVTLPRHEG